MQQSEQFFSNKQLKRMIIPLFIEQTRHLVIWLVRAIIFWIRYKKGTWQKFQVI